LAEIQEVIYPGWEMQLFMSVAALQSQTEQEAEQKKNRGIGRKRRRGMNEIHAAR
jgi:hypothetical protein